MKRKITRILGVVLTLSLLVSLAVTTAAPASADPEAWSTFDTPSATDMVLNTTITEAWSTFDTPSATDMVLNTTITEASAFAQSPVDGALYAAVDDGAVFRLLKSTDSGRTWTAPTAVLPAAAVAVAPSPTEANVVFYVDANTLYRSNDGGATFLTVLGAPAGDPLDETFTALDIAKWGGRYFAVVGTDNIAGSGGVLYWDENDIANNLATWGSAGSTFDSESPVLSLSLAPTFNVDRAMVVIGVDTANNMAIAKTNVNGGAWGAVIDDVTLTTTTADPIAPSDAAPTAADIGFPTDYNVSTSPVYYVAVSDADADDGGLYRIIGTADTRIDPGLTWNNLSVSGAWAGLSGSILVGSSNGLVKRSSNSGFTVSTVTLRSNVLDATAWVLIDKDYATNLQAYVLNLGGAGGAFNVTINSMANFNQWSLVNETLTNIVDLAVASNGDMFMITGAGPPNNIWRYFGAVWERVAVGIDGNIIRISEAYATDNVVAYALVGSTNAILISANNANSFTAQSAKPGSTFDVDDVVRALLVLGANSVVVGSDGDIITSTTVGFYWPEVTVTLGTVQSFDVASNGDIIAGGSTGVARSQDGGVTWTAISAGSPVDTTTLVAAANDYAATGTVYATGTDSGDDAGVWSWTFGTSTAWTQKDDTTLGNPQSGGDDVKTGTGIVTAPGISGVSMVYAADGSDVGEGVYRIKANRNEGEQLADAGVTETNMGLWYTPGSNTLWTVAGNVIRTYTDTLAVSGSGVKVENVTATGATVTWKALAKATDYLVVVNTEAETNFYEAPTGAGIVGKITSDPEDATQTTQTAAVTGLAANTTYNVSVWASDPVSSFIFAGDSSFTTLPGAITEPLQNLIPAHGATNIPVDGPAFAWGAPAGGATSYTWQLSTDPSFIEITEGEVNTTLTFLVWEGPLEYEQDYYWRVTATGSGLWATQVFTTVAETIPPVTVEPAPTPTITVSVPPATTQPAPTVTVEPPDVIVTVPQPTTTVVTVTQEPPIVNLPEEETPVYIWVIVAVGALLTIAVIVLIVRTRRVV